MTGRGSYVEMGSSCKLLMCQRPQWKQIDRLGTGRIKRVYVYGAIPF